MKENKKATLCFACGEKFNFTSFLAKEVECPRCGQIFHAHDISKLHSWGENSIAREKLQQQYPANDNTAIVIGCLAFFGLLLIIILTSC